MADDFEKYRNEDYIGKGNFATKGFFSAIYKTAAKLSHTQDNAKNLDFGCGWKNLRKFLKGKYVGYDIIPEFSEVKSISRLPFVPDRIFCLNSLEHLDVKGLRETLREFKRIAPRAMLITALPLENALNSFTRRIFIGSWRDPDHKLKWKEAEKIINEFYRPEKSKTVYLMSRVSSWLPRA